MSLNYTSTLIFRSLCMAILVTLTASINSSFGQAQPSGQHTERPAPPARDPNTPGYVTAKELPDGTNPPANVDGNFIIGPARIFASEMSAQDSVSNGAVIEFTMNSSDSKIYPGIARDANTFGTPIRDPARL